MGSFITKIFYSPVKSISFDSVNSIRIKKSIGLENDRIFSFSRNIDFNESKLIELNPNKRSLHNFLTLRNSPFLNKYNFSLSNNELALKRNNIEFIRISILNKNKFVDLVEILIKLEPKIKPPIFLLKNIENPFFDTTPNNSISLINLNSVKDFSKKINTEIEIERFRGNIYIDKMNPWDEMKLIGKNIKINNCNFQVLGSIPRCSATNLRPNTDNNTINLPLTLKKIYGHINMGIYLKPLNDGIINFKDEVYI